MLVLQPGDPEDFWLLPGGGVESAETSRDAAVRETREETGFTISAEHVLALHEGVDADPRTGEPSLHLEVVWKARLLPAEPGPAEHPWRFFAPAEIPPEVDLSGELRRVLGLD